MAWSIWLEQSMMSTVLSCMWLLSLVLILVKQEHLSGHGALGFSEDARIHSPDLQVKQQHLYCKRQWMEYITYTRICWINDQCGSMSLNSGSHLWNWHQYRSIGIDLYWGTFWINATNLIRHWLTLISINHWSSMSWYILRSFTLLPKSIEFTYFRFLEGTTISKDLGSINVVQV